MVATRTRNVSSSPETPHTDLNARVTERMLTALREGVVPWQQAHHRLEDGTMESPRNYSSGHRYSGQNLMLLECNTHDRPYYLTYRQALALGGQVRQGSKGQFILFWKFDEAGETETGKPRKGAYCQCSYVFHMSQIDGIDFVLPERVTLDVAEHERASLAKAEALVAQYISRERMPTVPGGLLAAYQTNTDSIQMPDKTAYTHPGGYYKTLFHEIIHSTGSAHRLNRPGVVDSTGIRSTERRLYAGEELTAELGAALLAMHCGIDAQAGASTENSAAYVGYWIQYLQHEPSAFKTAMSQAQKAVNYVLGTSIDEDPM